METCTRRGFLVLGGAVLLSGCSDGSTGPPPSPSLSASPRSSTRPSPSASPSRSPGPPGTASASASPGPALPRVSRWQPDANDLAPRAKVSAVRAVERRGNGARSALQVLEAQYGGLLAGSASVLVVCRTWRGSGGGIEQGGATYDVRLRRGAAGWRVVAVHVSRPGAAGRRQTPDESAVLGSTRIELPPAARADVRSGRVHESVLAALLALSQRYRIGVSVIRSGHPIHVFGTDRLSDHPRGRAFDTCRIDGRLVVDAGTPRRLVAGYMEAAASLGSYNVGGPYLLGAAPQYFSDDTHHDHVHAGFLG